MNYAPPHLDCNCEICTSRKRITEMEARELGYIQSLRELEATIAEQRKLMQDVVDSQSLGAVENAVTAIENYQTSDKE